MPDVRQRNTLGNRFRFLVRVLGLTGLVAAVVGAVLLTTVPTDLPGWADAGSRSPVEWATAAGTWASSAGQWLWNTATGGADRFTQVSAAVLLGGLVAIALWLVVELLGALFLVTGRRTAVGLNTYLQIGLAAALLVVVNAYSFVHYKRYDLTRDKQFTLPESVVERLRTFSPSRPTDIVVLQLHKTAGSLSDKPDALDFAAERKVVEKVKDLVDQLRELGPRFQVTVLDVEEEGYGDRLDALTRDAPALRAAIDAAPENSIFFHADGRVQRMSFGEFYLLDKAASQQEVNGKKRPTNLVLIPQGVEAFARKVEGVGEKRPKVGLAVIHPYLATRVDYEEYTAQGLRKALEANGFQVQDVILKKWGRGNPTPAADTFEEYELDRVEGRYHLLNLLAQNRDALVKQLSGALEGANKAATTADAAKVLQPFVRARIETAEDVKQVVASVTAALEEFRQEAKVIAEDLAKTAPKYQEALKNERAYEARRSTDVKAKFAAAVADCDVLIVPRMTVMDIPRRGVIESWLYSLSAEQADVIREFVKAGKPVLALFGPIKVGQGSGPPGEPEPDPVEQLFARLGVEFGGQTIVYKAETEAAAEQREEALGGGGAVPLPPLTFDVAAKGGKQPNPIAAAFATTGRAVDFKLDVNKSGFRPVYVSPAVAARQAFDPVVAQTAKEAWNEEKPTGDRDYVPKYDPAKLDDPKKGTRDEERRGPFPVGAAVEVPVPAEWLEPKLAAAQAAAAVGGAAFAPGGLTAAPVLDPAKYAAAAPAGKRPDPPTVRIVALGHGGLFVGKTLEPAEEKLLLHTLNWQLKRDDRLPKETAAKWQYPRAELSPQQFTLWRWGTFLGLPLLCAYFGLIVLMVRKVR